MTVDNNTPGYAAQPGYSPTPNYSIPPPPSQVYLNPQDGVSPSPEMIDGVEKPIFTTPSARANLIYMVLAIILVMLIFMGVLFVLVMGWFGVLVMAFFVPFFILTVCIRPKRLEVYRDAVHVVLLCGYRYKIPMSSITNVDYGAYFAWGCRCSTSRYSRVILYRSGSMDVIVSPTDREGFMNAINSQIGGPMISPLVIIV